MVSVGSRTGNADAQHKLGELYAKGCGLKRNYVEAIKWFRLSAEQGNAVAQKSLGQMYFGGAAVEQDSVAAYMWFNVALLNSKLYRKYFRESTWDLRHTMRGIEKVLTRSQIVRAQAMVKRCLATNYKDCG